VKTSLHKMIETLEFGDTLTVSEAGCRLRTDVFFNRPPSDEETHTRER